MQERFVIEEEERVGGIERKERPAREKIQAQIARVENQDVKGMERKKKRESGTHKEKKETK